VQLPGSWFSRCWPCVQPWSFSTRGSLLGLPGFKGPFWVPLLALLVRHGSSLLRSPGWLPAAPGTLLAGGDAVGMPPSRVPGGTAGCTRQVWRLGEGLDPIVSPVPSCSLAPHRPLALLVLLLARSSGAASWGAPHPQGHCKDNPALIFFGEGSGVCKMPGGTLSSTACCEGGLWWEQGKEAGGRPRSPTSPVQ